MTVKSGAAWASGFVTRDSTGALSAATVGPAGVLYVDGTATGTAVTITGANPYKWACTLPALTAGQTVAIYITATVATIATAAFVAEDVADTYLVSDIEALVDDIGVAGAGLTAIPWNAAWDAEVQSEATDALNAYDPPTKAEMLAAIAGIDVTVAMSATTAAAVASGSLAIRTYHTFSQSITSTSTAALNTATKVWLAVKSRTSDADSASQVFIEAAGGLTVLAGAAYTTTAHGTLVVTGSSGAWVITLGMDEVATGLLTAGSYVAEVKALVGANTVAVWDGTAVVSAGIVRAVV